MALIIKGRGKTIARTRRHVRLRKKVSGTTERPRLVVTRSARHIVAQVADATVGRTPASTSPLEADLRAVTGDTPVAAGKVGVERRGRDERAANGVVDHLRHDVPGRARHHEARTLRRTGDLLAKPHMTTGPGDCLAASLDYQSHRLLTSLSDLAADLLAGVPNTLALVRLGLADLADVRSDLAHLLLVDATDRELGRALHGDRDACRGGKRDRVREAEGELEIRALGRHAIPGSDDLELLHVALRDAGDEVRQQGPGEAVQ